MKYEKISSSFEKGDIQLETLTPSLLGEVEEDLLNSFVLENPGSHTYATYLP